MKFQVALLLATFHLIQDGTSDRVLRPPRIESPATVRNVQAAHQAGGGDVQAPRYLSEPM